MLPSPRLILLTLSLAPLFLAGAFYEPFTGIGVIYGLVLLAVAGFDLALLPRRSVLKLECDMPDRLSLGEPNLVRLRVTNRGRAPLRVAFAEDVPEEMVAEPRRCEDMVEGGGRHAFEYHVTPRKRGRYLLDALDVRAIRTGGLFYRQFRVRLPREVHVYPNLLNVKRYELALRKGMLFEQGLARQRQIGQGFEFESLRQFHTGDDMSRVAWKTTAKRSRLIVKNYEPERQQSVLVALDVGRATAGEFEGISRLDYLVNAALMLAYVALRQGDWFSLVAFSDRVERYLPPVRRVQSLDRVARALYELAPRLTESDYGGACRFLDLRNRKRSLICLMTDVIDREASGDILGYLAHYARYHLPLAVTLADPPLQAVARAPMRKTGDPYRRAVAIDVLEAREQALAAMRHRGVSVLDAHPKSLTPDLVNRYLLIKSTRRL
jgi:uncharacterized protein (DUF58 family)